MENERKLPLYEAVELRAEEVVFQERYDESEEVDYFADFLRFLNDEYGPSTSRYSSKRIYITVEPGDKYEGTEDGSQKIVK